MCLQINLSLQQQLIVLIVSLHLGLHPSPLRGFVLLHLGLCHSPLGPLACIWPVSGFSSYRVMPFGLKNARTTYQRLMDRVFK